MANPLRMGWSTAEWSRSRPDSGREPAHRYKRPDPYPDWLMSPVVLAGIDRWGWIEPWTPMHPASVSGLVHAIRALLDGPAPRPAPAVVDAPASPPRRISPEEEAEIHARADEVYDDSVPAEVYDEPMAEFEDYDPMPILVDEDDA